MLDFNLKEKTMKKVKYLWILGFMFLCGCADWLDVESKTEVSADQLFDNERGFVVALNGIYSTLAMNDMYGGELMYGAIEAIGRGVATERIMYSELRNFNYEYSSVKSFIASIWEKSYNLIANCNEILDQVDKKGKDFFTGNNYEVVKGQALAARAMLHFNVARFFAPVPGKGDEMLPYYEDITSVPAQTLSTSEFMKRVIRDFSEAQELLAVNDTLTTEKTNMRYYRFTYNMSSMDKPIGFRLNYYAVTALLARAALWMGDKGQAYQNANILIDRYSLGESLISFTSPSMINAGRHDRLFSEDILFGLYRQTDELSDAFTSLAGTCYVANYGYVFDSGEADLRKNLIEALAGGNYRTYKYSATHFKTNKNFLLPMIRLSEMYYIVAEVLADTDLVAATEKLDYVRKQRGVKNNLTVPGDKDSFIDVLIDEVRRETLAEGQMFFYYKRLSYPILDETEGNKVVDEEFTFPIPESETIG